MKVLLNKHTSALNVKKKIMQYKLLKILYKNIQHLSVYINLFMINILKIMVNEQL